MIPEVPDKLQYRITRLGGRSPDGQPLFRMVRGCDRMTWMGGRWMIYDEHHNLTGEWIGEKQVPKHADAIERYIFEMWCPPENYGTPEEWESQFSLMFDGQKVRTLGPFPYQGEYELVKVLETPTRRLFVPLTEAICDAAVNTAVLNKELPAQIRVEAARKQREREERARVTRQIDMIENMMQPKDFAQPHVVMPSDYDIAKYT
jgi:hypothetical protein